MASKRKIIREKVKEMLLNKTACGEKVFENRIAQWWPESLPAISIYSSSESSEIWNVSPRKYKRKLNLSIEVVAMASEDIDDVLDNLAQQVEDVLNTGRTLQGVCDDVTYQGSQLSMVEDGAKLFSVAKLDYEIVYASYHGEDTSNFDDFALMSTAMKITEENSIVTDTTLEV